MPFADTCHLMAVECVDLKLITDLARVTGRRFRSLADLHEPVTLG